jgi:hypothetical protein
LHVKEHWLFMHVGVACSTWVVHAVLQFPQWFLSLVVSTQVMPQRVGAVPGQPELQEKLPPDPAQSGVCPLHVTPHPPQLLVVLIAVSHPWSGPPAPQCA